ncbi:hypothetical protein DYB32_001809 [Aphanomyces invadans]|uniref:Nucleotide-diphospho-sugar transferase domain-containing protein n=1 Tax=Aphanomyces invadans TaxID=157072 RepID=A0A418B4Z3_9STRA|nr:hypothetical protein DYB32_001809 [Aphanomyces invadans]
MAALVRTLVIAAIVVVGATLAANESRLHIVYSTSCNQGKRQLLSYALQTSAMAVGQQGKMTEMLSGCTPVEEATIAAEPSFYHTFSRHFTPSYSPHPVSGVNDDYTPYNKPFGLRHFLQTPGAVADDAIVVLLDADFILFKPIEVNTGRSMRKYYKGRRTDMILDTVENGVAIAQDWTAYIGSGWLNPSSNVKPFLCKGQPCMNVSEADAIEYFTSTGPPYILTKHDALLMVDDYCAFVVEGRKHVDKDEWMPEMYALGVAMANHNIKQTKVTNLGVTFPDHDVSEYWNFANESLPNPCQDAFDIVTPVDPPLGVHYCYPYGLLSPPEPSWHFTKYHLPADILDCQSMLLTPHPPSQWNEIAKLKPKLQQKKRHEVWVECTLVKVLNNVLLQAKQVLCPNGFNSHRGMSLDRDVFIQTGLPAPT